MKYLLPLAFWLSLFLGCKILYAAPVLIEQSYIQHETYKVVVRSYREDDHLCAIHVFIDDESVYRVHSIPENMLRYAFSKVRSKLDGIIADYETNGVLGDYGGIDG
jgi:nitrate/nitrite-specific signal transduction histidine kinase